MEADTQNQSSMTSRAVWLLIAKVIGFVFTFALPLLIVRVFNKSQIGLYQQVFLLIVNVTTTFSLNVGASAYYFLPREPENRQKSILNILIYNICAGIFALIVFSAFPQLPGLIFEDSAEQLTNLSPLIGLVICFWIFSAFIEVVAVANREAKTAASFIILAQFTKTALLFSFAWFFTTIESLLYAALIQALLQTVILLIYLNLRFPRFWREFDASFFYRQLVYAIPFGFAGILWTMQIELHKYFVGHYFTAEDYAVYSIGCFSLPLIGMLAESVNSITLPRMSELQKEDNRREMINLTVRVFRKLSLVYFPLYIFLMITAYTFILTLFTDKFAASVPIFMVNLTLLPFDGFIVDSIARAYPEIGRFLFKTRIVIFIALAGLLSFGIKHFDLRGMIAIVVCINLLERFITAWRIGTIIGVKKSDIYLLKDFPKMIAASLSAGFFTYFAYNFIKNHNPTCLINLCDGRFGKWESLAEGIPVLIISGIIFAAFYLLFLRIFNVLGEEEYELLQALKDKIPGLRAGKTVENIT